MPTNASGEDGCIEETSDWDERTVGIPVPGLVSFPANEKPPFPGAFVKRMKGLEPSTFCMASRRSSQLSYIRVKPEYSDGRK